MTDLLIDETQVFTIIHLTNRCSFHSLIHFLLCLKFFVVSLVELNEFKKFKIGKTRMFKISHWNHNAKSNEFNF